MIAEDLAPRTSDDVGAFALQQLSRLIRLSGFHAMDNDSIQQAIRSTTQAIDEACAGRPGFTVTFSGEGVWIDARLLKAPRQTYELCREVGVALQRVGANQLGFQAGVTEAALRRFVLQLKEGGAKSVQDLNQGSTPQLALRKVRMRLPTALIGEGQSSEQAVRLYVGAVVVTQRLIDQFWQGRERQLRHLRRLAQRLVVHTRESPEVLQQLVQLRGGRRDLGTRAVHTAVLALFGAGRVLQERRALLRIAMAGLTLDLSRARAAGLVRANPEQLLRLGLELDLEQANRLPDATAYVFLSGGLQATEALGRATILFEAQWLRRAGSLGAPYGGQRPVCLEAGMIGVARRLVDRVTETTLVGPLTFAQAARRLSPELTTPLERRCLELITAGAGMDS